jgi:hypothetical protein
MARRWVGVRRSVLLPTIPHFSPLARIIARANPPSMPISQRWVPGTRPSRRSGRQCAGSGLSAAARASVRRDEPQPQHWTGPGRRMVWPEKIAFGSVIFGLKDRIAWTVIW